MTTLNPLTGRRIKIGSSVYNKLVREGILKTLQPLDIFQTLGDADIYALCQQMDYETLENFRLTSKRVASICDATLLAQKYGDLDVRKVHIGGFFNYT